MKFFDVVCSDPDTTVLGLSYIGAGQIVSVWGSHWAERVGLRAGDEIFAVAEGDVRVGSTRRLEAGDCLCDDWKSFQLFDEMSTEEQVKFLKKARPLTMKIRRPEHIACLHKKVKTAGRAQQQPKRVESSWTLAFNLAVGGAGMSGARSLAGKLGSQVRRDFESAAEASLVPAVNAAV